MFLFLLPTWACPPTAAEVEKARFAFDDAEVDAAADSLRAAVMDLDCQTTVVETSVLLELFRLDALVALSAMDSKAAVYSTIRAIAVEPKSAPPAAYGPELAKLYATWSERLDDATATLSVLGAGTVWLDGHPLTHGMRVTVPQGEHLVQTETGTGIHSRVQDITLDGILETGRPAPPNAPPAPRPVVEMPDLPDGDPELVMLERPEPTRREDARRRPPALWIAGGALVAVGAGTIGWGALQERTFKNTTHDSDAAVSRASSQIRGTYGTGYGLAGIGAVLLTTNAVGFPAVSVSGRW